MEAGTKHPLRRAGSTCVWEGGERRGTVVATGTNRGGGGRVGKEVMEEENNLV
jgi:hypothetical protein